MISNSRRVSLSSIVLGMNVYVTVSTVGIRTTETHATRSNRVRYTTRYQYNPLLQ